MGNAEKRIMYNNVIYTLENICRKVEELNTSINNLCVNEKRNVLINGKGLNEEVLSSLGNDLGNISREIKGNVVPSLYNKIYTLNENE